MMDIYNNVASLPDLPLKLHHADPRAYGVKVFFNSEQRLDVREADQAEGWIKVIGTGDGYAGYDANGKLIETILNGWVQLDWQDAPAIP